MNRKSKTKKGFTLVEVLLAVAIMVMTAGVFFSLMLVVMKSHSNVVAANDLADYAMLTGRAFENVVINAKNVGKGSNAITADGNKLCLNGNPLFELDQYKTFPDGEDKWQMEFTAQVCEGGIVKYTIHLTDSFTQNVEGLANFDYEYNGEVYVPHAKEVVLGGSNDTFLFDNY
jgi:prepilin-type N-terminal cleavage/methylation domain-containing protein